MRHIRRGGAYSRVADPHWENPLDGSHARRSGGRWNPPGSFSVVSLNRDVRVARVNVARKFRGRPYGPELLDPHEAPVLVQTTVPEANYVDIITDEGCMNAGLPKQYPNDPTGGVVGGNDVSQSARRHGSQAVQEWPAEVPHQALPLMARNWRGSRAMTHLHSR